MNSDVDSVKAILTFATDSGVDASSLLQPNANGRTPLHYTAMNEFGETFDTILTWAMSNGVPLVPLFEADPKGRTPLHLMVNYQNLSYAEAAKKIFQIAHSCGQLPVLLRTDWTENTLLNFYVCLQFKELLYNQIILEPWIWPTLFPSQSR
jgi:hypothetical protein